MRPVISLALPFALIAIPTLLICCPSLTRTRPPPSNAAQSQIVVHILAMPNTSKPSNMRSSPMLALPTSMATSTATDSAKHASTNLAVTAEPVEADEPIVTIAPVISSEPTDVPPTFIPPVPAIAPEPETGLVANGSNQLLGLHNQVRTEAGLPPYRLSLQLQQDANGPRHPSKGALAAPR